MTARSIAAILLCLAAVSARADDQSHDAAVAALKASAASAPAQRKAAADAAAKVAAIKEEKDWKNPILVLTPKGILVNSNQPPLKPDYALEAVLKLPKTAWPLGKIVGIERPLHLPAADDQAVGVLEGELLISLKNQKITQKMFFKDSRK